MAESDEQPEPVDSEDVRVRERRYREAIAAGLTCAESRIFADNGIDVGQLRACVAGGCDPVTMAAIVV